MTDTIDSLKEAEKEAMGEGNRPRQVQRCGSNSTGGLILIGIGLFFLLSQTFGFFIYNWWALFILIPAVHNLNEAWQSYGTNGRLRGHARRSLMGGILLTMVALFFLFNLSWNLFWPIVLIMLGVNALINSRSK
jgi:LiaF transmembrane domain